MWYKDIISRKLLASTGGHECKTWGSEIKQQGPPHNPQGTPKYLQIKRTDPDEWVPVCMFFCGNSTKLCVNFLKLLHFVISESLLLFKGRAKN